MKPWIWFVVLGLAAAVAFLLLLRRNGRIGAGGTSGNTAELVNEYRRLSHLSKIEAADALDRHVETLRKKQPGKSLDWYIAQAVEELRADRRRS